LPIPTTLHSTYPQLSTPHLHNHQIYRIPPTFQSPPTPKPIRHPTQTPHRQPRPIANLTSTYPERQHHLLSPTPRRAPSRNPLTTSQLRKSPLHGHPRLAVPVQRLISQSADYQPIPQQPSARLCPKAARAIGNDTNGLPLKEETGRSGPTRIRRRISAPVQIRIPRLTDCPGRTRAARQRGSRERAFQRARAATDPLAAGLSFDRRRCRHLQADGLSFVRRRHNPLRISSDVPGLLPSSALTPSQRPP